MGTPKLTNFMYAILFVGFFSVVFVYFMTDLFHNYGTPNDVSNNLQLFNQINQMNNLTSSVQEKALNFKTNSNFLDVIGFYMSGAMDSMKLGFQSFSIFVTMTNAAFTDNYMSFAGSQYLKSTLILCVLIALIIGVFISAIMKKDL